MSEWTEESLGRLASIEIGGTPSRDIPAFWASENAEGFPWVSIADLGPRFVSATKERITELGVLSSNVKPVRSGTLMMSFKLTIGRAGIAARDLYTNEAIAAFVPMPRTVDSGFLYYLLPPIARNAVTDAAIKGSTLNKQTLSKLKLRFPKDMQQQRRIAEILSTVDEAIEQTVALIAKHQQIKTGLMHDLFTRGVTPDGHLRPTRERAPDHYKESALGWIPKDWEVGMVGDVIAGIEQGWSPDCETYPANNQEWGVLKTSSVAWGGFDRTENKKLPSHLLPRPDLRINKGDVLMTRAGPNSRVGVVALVDNEPGRLMLSDKIYRLVPAAGLSSEFLTSALSSAATQHDLDSFKTGLAESQTNISQAIVRRLSLPIPKKDERDIICDRISVVTDQIRITGAHQSKLKTLRHGLMHDLLSGRVPVQHKGNCGTS